LQFEPPARPTLRRHARISDILEQAWDRGWLARPVLEPDHLIAAARKRTGLDDLGSDPGLQVRLAALTEALHAEAALSPLGTVIAYGQLVAALADRARVHALWRRHPEILEVPIPRPIIVLGQMRSGSTRMQRLLACDPRLAHTRFFESWNPVPVTSNGWVDDRRIRAWIGLRCAQWLNPDFRVIHPTALEAADEEIGLHNVSIFGAAFEAQWRIPSFAAAGEAMDTRPVYAEFKRLMQTVAWLRKERGDRPWVLKLPQFAQDLDSLLTTFPDARLVCLDRKASAVVGSSASLVHSQMAVQSDAVDPHWIGAEWVRKVALREQRMRSARASADVPQVDVGFDAIGKDWEREMRRVYRMLDLPLTDAVRDRMQRYLDQRRHRRLARHRYTLGEFGLSEAEVECAVRNPGRAAPEVLAVA
jgi:hypothetical protein